METQPDDRTKPPMSPTEVGQLVRLLREGMGWSQETLAELSSLTVRTIQRVEAGQPSSLDTRRALARGFQMPDMDVFSKSNPFPTAEDLARQKAAFDREHMVLEARMVDGRTVLSVLSNAQGLGAIIPGSTVDLPSSAQDAFASIIDYARDCLDIVDEVSQREMLNYGDGLDAMVADLRKAGFSLCLAQRKTSITNKSWADPTPLPVSITYLVAAPTSAPPSKVVVPRKMGSFSF